MVRLRILSPLVECFSLSLSLRAVRTFVHSSFLTKPVKIFQVNVYVSAWTGRSVHIWSDPSRAGYVNPLQHMREPNENVIQMVRAKVKESVQALEALLEWQADIHVPVNACFSLIDGERGIVACDWSRSEVYPKVEYRARVRSFSFSPILHRWLLELDRLRSGHGLFPRTELRQCLHHVSTRARCARWIRSIELLLLVGWISRCSSDDQSLDGTESSFYIERPISARFTCCAHVDRSAHRLSAGITEWDRLLSL